jgi:alkanesulfonate monooxygenase SsuD/methylene tetrahydromethanopterin reductase-like flavin-dependent oxidoreductase (luciferase family)
LQHRIKLAKFLDDNNFHGIFFADVLGIYDVYKGDGPALSSGAQVPILDISLLISALAAATTKLSFGITASTTYENPYALAKKFATLDYLTNGRVGWNIVTSYLESAAKSYGLEQGIEHNERYRIADEFLGVVYKLLESSWREDAVEANKATGVWTNPEKVRKIDRIGYVADH